EGAELIDRYAPYLETWTGLKPDEVEDVLVGARIDVFPPKVWLVVRTKAPADLAKLRKALRSTRTFHENDRELDEVQPPGLLPMALWLASPRTLVLSRTAADLAKVPLRPAEGIDHLPPPLADLLRYRSEKESLVWLVAHANDWTQ